jgi:peptidoglycan/LPS O-acetylase OafA/YrhL
MVERRSRIVLLLVSALLVSTCGVFAVDSPIMLSFGLTALYIGFGGVLILALYSDPREKRGPPKWLEKFRVGNLAAYIGMYSYSIYLWHGMVAQHSRGFLRLLWPKACETAFFWGYVFMSLAIGIVLSRIIEYPTLNLRDRLFPSIQPIKNQNRESSMQLAVNKADL